MSTTYSNILLHYVFSTKDRRPFFSAEDLPRVHGYLGGIVRNMKCVPYEIGGISDHVHLLVRMNTSTAPADFVRNLKSSCTTWLHEELPSLKQFAWQTGYAVLSVSQSQADRVSNYVRNQERHHRKRGFKEELRELLDKHKIEYDEKYMWD